MKMKCDSETGPGELRCLPSYGTSQVTECCSPADGKGCQEVETNSPANGLTAQHMKMNAQYLIAVPAFHPPLRPARHVMSAASLSAIVDFPLEKPPHGGRGDQLLSH